MRRNAPARTDVCDVRDAAIFADPLLHFAFPHNIHGAITCLRDRCGVHAVHSRDATAMCTSLHG
jgi:hypothetical protein